MEILFGFIVAMFLIFAFAAGLSKACSWVFEIGLWLSIILLVFFLITIGVFITLPFLVSCVLCVGLGLIIVEAIGGKKDE